MSTFIAKSEQIERKWYIVDAANKPLGRTAVVVAKLLHGKEKVEFTPNADCGDYVIVINCDKAVLTGNKLTQKYYRTHSGYVSGLKEVQYGTLMAKKPELAMMLAVRRMLPKNHTGREQLKRLKLFAGAEHIHAAQKPEVYAGN